jgi:hypothetical protein
LAAQISGSTGKIVATVEKFFSGAKKEEFPRQQARAISGQSYPVLHEFPLKWCSKPSTDPDLPINRRSGSSLTNGFQMPFQ